MILTTGHCNIQHYRRPPVGQAGAPTQIRKWGDNYGERSEPKKFFARRGDNPPRNSKTNNAGIKLGGIDPPHPPGVGAYAHSNNCLFLLTTVTPGKRCNVKHTWSHLTTTILLHDSLHLQKQPHKNHRMCRAFHFHTHSSLTSAIIHQHSEMYSSGRCNFKITLISVA
jgi:hypothetical protein